MSDNSPKYSTRALMLWLAMTVIPVVVFLLFLNGPALSLAKNRSVRTQELYSLRENVYRPSWLDSAMGQLENEVTALNHFQKRVKNSLSLETMASAIHDPLRQEAQRFGCEVLRLSPSVESVDKLQRLKVRLETRGDFSSALMFFRSLRLQHPEVYIEEMLLRQDPSFSKLNLNLTLVIHLAQSKVSQ